MTNYATMTIGIVLGDTWSVLCVLDEGGEVVKQSRVRTRCKEIFHVLRDAAWARTHIVAVPRTPHTDR